MSPMAAPKKDPQRPGTWYITVENGTRPDGRRKQVRRRGFPTQAAARKAYTELSASVQNGIHIDRSTVSVGDYLTSWLDDTLPVTVRESTSYSYRRNLRHHVIPRIGHIRLQSLRGPNLNRLYADLLEPGANRRSPSKGLSRRTVRYIHTVLHRAFGDAVRHGLLDRNPADLADPPVASQSVEASKVKHWTAEQVATFLELSTAEGDRDFGLWRLVVSTGMRRGEALGLRWCDVDLDAATVTVTQSVGVVDHQVRIEPPKTGAGLRTIAIDAGTVAALRAHRSRRGEERMMLGIGQASPTDFVFAEPTGEHLHPEAVSKRFDRRVARYGLPHIAVHGLRHTWATLALQAGVHPRVVQERLGHSTISVTLGIYSHVIDGQDAEAAQQVADLFDGSFRDRSLTVGPLRGL